MPTYPFLTDLVRALPATVPFVGPEALQRMRGRPFRARLGANESVFGPSPKSIAAMEAAAASAFMYGDPENFELRAAIAKHHGVSIENVAVGEGIDGLLGLAVKVAVAPGEVVVTSDGAYPTFNYHVAVGGGRLVKVPFRDDKEDLGAVLDAGRAENAKILYVSNPNNPMGSWWSASEIEGMISALPPTVLFCLDEAYCDTAPPAAVPDIDISNPRVLRFRTFSKAYGLAGARVGYALGEAGLISIFDKIRNHYGMSRSGQIGALAALADQDYLAETVGRIAAGRDRLAQIARENGLAPLPSATNFVTMDCGRDGTYATRVLDEIIARDVFVRMPGVAPLNRCIRVTVGTPDDLDVFAEVLPEALRAAQG
ncbi:pyridoxal phosphate-dependent aminotransferase [Filomicrobium sp.]|uniref:pyridoxal phosphate-dependent aminotransferase n=1 Tax=Filomicrobium sp. TaxID=2024831 RepID=UPI00258C5982|nr:pyridoxal phosphate-dependent aminotransferase [Filomicrobium sp.]MCV0371141.1 pyridoxal phosphate-dependent aminotransferase [Filomicrobium sp.]